MPGRLFICATPIGNLGDVSSRLVETLSKADVVFAEDTRRVRKLLTHLGLAKPVQSYFVGNEGARAAELADRLEAGETVALVSDAGVPGIADPGLTAVRVARKVGAAVSAIPGPSAVTTALAASGMPGDRFVFEGFLPRKGADRAARLAAIAAEERTVVLFAAKRRLGEDLADLAASAGPDRAVVVTRELTKMHEELWWGTLAEAARHWGGEAPLGELTLVIAGAEPALPDVDAALEDVVRARAGGAPLSGAVREAARRHGVDRGELYDRALAEEAR